MSEGVIPCVACNQIAHDLGFTYNDLVKAGAIVNGKVVKHFKNCPFDENAYSRVTGRQSLESLAEILRSGPDAMELFHWYVWCDECGYVAPFGGVSQQEAYRASKEHHQQTRRRFLGIPIPGSGHKVTLAPTPPV